MLVFSFAVHEHAHGYAALRQGDDTALQQGRLTLNPIPHIDVRMTLIVPALTWYFSKGAFIFGGAKPVQVRPDRYRNSGGELASPFAMGDRWNIFQR